MMIPGLQGAMLDMALGQFKKELKNPNSQVSKKFNGMLYGDPKTGSKGLLDQITDPQNLFSENKPVDTSKYKRKLHEALVDNSLNLIGSAAEGVGKAAGTYQSLLGDALMAITGSYQQGNLINPLAMMPAVAFGHKTKGGVYNILGQTAGDILHNTSKDIAYNREKDKQTELLLNEHPSGQYFDARKQLTKNTRGLTS